VSSAIAVFCVSKTNARTRRRTWNILDIIFKCLIDSGVRQRYYKLWTVALETLIEASSLSKRFAGRAILENVEFSIHPGEVMTLVGLNGCGKTTLLRILLGLEQADSGEVHRREGLRIGYLPQRFSVDVTIPL